MPQSNWQKQVAQTLFTYTQLPAAVAYQCAHIAKLESACLGEGPISLDLWNAHKRVLALRQEAHAIAGILNLLYPSNDDKRIFLNAYWLLLAGHPFTDAPTQSCENSLF